MDLSEVKVLDHGSVSLISISTPGYTDRSADENVIDTICAAARISHGKKPEDYSSERNMKLVKYLFEHEHMSPFEQVSVTFKVTAPIFVRTHFFRHRTAKVNEISARYTEVADDYYHPSMNIRKQSEKNHQASQEFDDKTRLDKAADACVEMEKLMDQVFAKYKELLCLGVSREQARAYLPQSSYTTFIYQQDLRNLIHMLKLRRGADAQGETCDFAKAMCWLLQQQIPSVLELLKVPQVSYQD